MDSRDAERFNSKWYESFDADHMVFTIIAENEDGEEEVVEFPAKWEVCGLCEGRGSHVNPGVDSQGISAEDFAEDPGFREDYFGGMYDESCYRCNGRTTEAVVDYDNLTDEQKSIYDDTRNDLASFDAERAAEIRMGC